MAEPSKSIDSSGMDEFGYAQTLDRSIGKFASFAAGISYISILTGTFQLFYFGTFLPHRHLPANGSPMFADHHRTRSNGYGTLMSLLTCFHFGYHHEHHLHPGEPWWRLPAEYRRRASLR